MVKKLDFFGVNKKSNVPLNRKPFQPFPKIKPLKNNSFSFNNNKPLKIKSILTTNRVPLYSKRNTKLYGDADFDGSPNKWDCSWNKVEKDGLLSDLWDKTKSMFKKKDENLKVIPKKRPETPDEVVLRKAKEGMKKQVEIEKLRKKQEKKEKELKYERSDLRKVDSMVPISGRGIFRSIVGDKKLLSSGVELQKVKVINPETGKEETVLRETYNPKRFGTYRERAREKSNVIQGRLLLGVNAFLGAGKQIAPPPKAVYIGDKKIKGGIGGKVGRPRKTTTKTPRRPGRPSGPSGQYRINGKPVGVYEWREYQRKRKYLQKFGGPSVASENIPDYETQQFLEQQSQQPMDQPEQQYAEQQIDPRVLEQMRQQEESQQLPYTNVEYQKQNPYVNDPQYQRQLEEKQMMEEQLMQEAQMQQLQQYAIDQNQIPASRMNIPTNLDFTSTMAPAPDINRGDLIQTGVQPMAEARSNVASVRTKFKNGY